MGCAAMKDQVYLCQHKQYPLQYPHSTPLLSGPKNAHSCEAGIQWSSRRWLVSTRMGLLMYLLKGLILCGSALFVLTQYWYHWPGSCASLSTIGVPRSGDKLQSFAELVGAGRVLLNTSNVLECFQVHEPVLTAAGWSTKSVADDEKAWEEEEKKYGEDEEDKLDGEFSAGSQAKSCSVLLMEHSFGFSYGHPFVGERYALNLYDLANAQIKVIINHHHAISIASP